MKWICIETDSVIPVEAIEVLGATSKDGVSTIGKFGSGIKYAISAALRNNIDVRIASGDKMIRFATREMLIGNVTQHRITMQIGNNKPKDRDWTTEMGKHDWKDRSREGISVDWMILREFTSNAIDEGVWRLTLPTKLEAHPGKTRIFIAMTNKMEEIMNNKHDYFIRMDVERDPVATNCLGSMYSRKYEKGRIYHRGVFVQELPERLLFDYDLDNVDLDESRILKSWYFPYQLGQFLTYLDAVDLAKILKSVRDNPDSYEAKLRKEHLGNLNDAKAKEAFVCAYGDSAYIAPKSAPVSVNEAMERSGGSPIIMNDGWGEALNEKSVPNYIDVIGRDVVHGYQYIEESEVGYTVNQYTLNLAGNAYEMCCKLFASQLGDRKKPLLKFFFWRGIEDGAAMGNSDKETFVGINASYPWTKEDMLITMIEEFAHYVSRAGDMERALMTCVCRATAKNLLEEDN